MTPATSVTWPICQIEPFLDYLHIECGLADNTIESYRRDLKRFTRYCLENSTKDPTSITPLALQNYGRFLSGEKLCSASIARHLVTVRMFMRYHVLFRLVDIDVCTAMETPKTWQRLPKVLSQAQTLDLICAVDEEDPYYLRDRALLELLYATGMRASEAAGLNLDDLNFQIGYLRCFGKGNKERIIPVHKMCLEVLGHYLDELRPHLVGDKLVDTVFVSRTGRALNRIEIWRIVRKAAVRAGMKGKISPHTLRHCFGSHLLQGGADLRSVQEMLGHADVTTTQIYTHVDQQHLRNIHKKYHPRP
ncbi:MAG: site-specific tyrosine recombinase XerD [Sedimentisphaerales bacterium]|nr:site-specific tyrosine recombinase XerD [Sedimentisphaerales bacterium]